MNRTHFLKIMRIVVASALISNVALANGASMSLDDMMDNLSNEVESVKTEVQENPACAVAIGELAPVPKIELDSKQEASANKMADMMLGIYRQSGESSVAATQKLSQFSEAFRTVQNVTANPLVDTSLSELKFSEAGKEIKTIMIDINRQLMDMVPGKQLSMFEKAKRMAGNIPKVGQYIKGAEDWAKEQGPARKVLNESIGNYGKLVKSLGEYIKTTEEQLPKLEAAKKDLNARMTIIKAALQKVELQLNNLGADRAEEAQFIKDVVLVQMSEDYDTLLTIYNIQAQTLLIKQQFVRVAKKSLRMNNLRLHVAVRAMTNGIEMAVANTGLEKVNQGGDLFKATGEKFMTMAAEQLQTSTEKLHEMQREGAFSGDVIQEVQTSIQNTIQADDAFQKEYLGLLKTRIVVAEEHKAKIDEFTEKLKKRNIVETRVNAQTNVNQHIMGGEQPR